MYYGYLGNTRKVVFCQSTYEYFSKLCHIKKLAFFIQNSKQKTFFNIRKQDVEEQQS